MIRESLTDRSFSVLQSLGWIEIINITLKILRHGCPLYEYNSNVSRQTEQTSLVAIVQDFSFQAIMQPTVHLVCSSSDKVIR